MNDCLVNITVTSYNRREATKACLAALRANTRLPVCVTVVDNASVDGSQALLRELHASGVIDKLFLCADNVGVAVASNLGWAAVNAPYYVKLDNDVVVLRHDWLETLIDIAESQPGTGTAGYYIEATRPESLAGEASFTVSTCVGSCILIPQATHERLGFWNEDYGIYGIEDSDFSTRVTTAGLANRYVAYSERFICHSHSLYAGDQAHDDDVRKTRGLTDEHTARFYFNSGLYLSGVRPLYVPRKFRAHDRDGAFWFSPDPAYLRQEHAYARERDDFIAAYCRAVDDAEATS